MRDLLVAHPDIVVAGEAGDISTASAMAGREKPDVLFLDVVMPGGSGLKLLSSLDPRPQIIFTTAYSNYAVNAFDENAVDYLVKPVSSDRLELAVTRLRRTLHRELPENGNPSVRRPTRIAVRHRTEVLFLNVADVTWISAEGNYCRVHTQNASYLMRGLINHMEARFGSEVFARVHRSSLVNVGRIQKLIVTGTGHSVVLEDGTTVRVGSSYRHNLAHLLDRIL